MYAFILALFTILYWNLAWAADFYVVPTASRNCAVLTCDGSQANPWNRGNHTSQLSTAGHVDTSVMSSGDTLYICGHHTAFPQNIFFANKSGIRISGACAGDPGSITTGFVAMRDADDTTLEDISITGTALYSQGVSIVNAHGVTVQRVTLNNLNKGIITSKDGPADNATIQDNIITNTEEAILLAAYTNVLSSVHKGWTIQGNTITNVQPIGLGGHDYEGIGVMGAVNVTIHDNTITNSRFCIRVWAPATGYIDGLTISDNNCINTTGAPSSWPSRAIIKEASNSDAHTGVEITGNTINGVDAQAIRWHATDTNPTPVLISNNTITNAGEPAIEYSGNITLEEGGGSVTPICP